VVNPDGSNTLDIAYKPLTMTNEDDGDDLHRGTLFIATPDGKLKPLILTEKVLNLRFGFRVRNDETIIYKLEFRIPMHTQMPQIIMARDVFVYPARGFNVN
jgi:hypothetical protein